MVTKLLDEINGMAVRLGMPPPVPSGGPHRGGRTTRLLLTVMCDIERHVPRIYVVAHSSAHAQQMMTQLRAWAEQLKWPRDRVPAAVTVCSMQEMDEWKLRGIEQWGRLLYVDHHAQEQTKLINPECNCDDIGESPCPLHCLCAACHKLGWPCPTCA